MAQINGQYMEVFNKNLAQLLAEKGWSSEVTVVEINEVIIRQEDYENTLIQNDDIVEVIQFVGGG